MERLALDSGGAFSPTSNKDELAKLYETAFTQILGQYRLTYTSPTLSGPNQKAVIDIIVQLENGQQLKATNRDHKSMMAAPGASAERWSKVASKVARQPAIMMVVGRSRTCPSFSF